MATKVIDILESEDQDAIEKYGSLSGTDKQRDVIRAALEDPESEPADLADRFDYSEGHTRNVLRRAEPELIDEVREELGSATETEEAQSEADEADEEEPEPVQSPMPFDEDEAQPSAEWHGEGIGKLVEVSALEWCDECQDRHRVIYLVPASQLGYLRGPECGHGGRYKEADEGTKEHVQRIIEAIERRVAP